MRILLAFTLSMVMMTAGASAEFLAKDSQTVRLDYIFDDDLGPDDGNGVELGFGTAVYELDDLAIAYTYIDADAVEHQQLVLSAQEYFPIRQFPIIPFAGAAIGYGWTDISGSTVSGPDLDRGGMVLRVEGGAAIKLCDWFSLFASARYNYSSKNLFPESSLTDLEDTNWNYAFGARFYY